MNVRSQAREVSWIEAFHLSHERDVSIRSNLNSASHVQSPAPGPQPKYSDFYKFKQNFAKLSS